MTPEEQMSRDELAKALKAGYGPIILEADEWRPIADHMLAAIEQARREEREACARYMDAVGQPGFATQLRARAREQAP